MPNVGHWLQWQCFRGISNAFTAPPPTGDARARNVLSVACAWDVLSVACAWGANSTQEVGGVLGVEGSVGLIEGKRLCHRAQAVGGPLPPA